MRTGCWLRGSPEQIQGMSFVLLFVKGMESMALGCSVPALLLNPTLGLTQGCIFRAAEADCCFSGPPAHLPIGFSSNKDQGFISKPLVTSKTTLVVLCC